MQTVLDAIDIGEVTVIYLLHLLVWELDCGSGGAAWTRDTKKGIKGVSAALHLLDSTVLDYSKMEHTTVSGTDLHAARSENQIRGGEQRADRTSTVSAMGRAPSLSFL